MYNVWRGNGAKRSFQRVETLSVAINLNYNEYRKNPSGDVATEILLLSFLFILFSVLTIRYNN
jgi:hypothetical protein